MNKINFPVSAGYGSRALQSQCCEAEARATRRDPACGRQGRKMSCVLCPVSSSKSLWSYQEGSGRLLSNLLPVINEETEACPGSVKVFRDISGLNSAGISGEQHPLTFELSPARRSQHLAD